MSFSDWAKQNRVIKASSFGEWAWKKYGIDTSPKPAKTVPEVKRVDPAFALSNNVVNMMLSRGPTEEISKNAQLSTASKQLEEEKTARATARDVTAYKEADAKAKSLQDTIDLLNGKQKPTAKDVVENLRDRTFSGIAKFNKGITATVDLLLPTEFLGKYDVVSKANETAGKNVEAFDQKNEERSQKFGKSWDVVGDVFETIVSAAPQAVAAILTGGTSAAASTASLTSEATAGGLASTVYNSLATMVKSPLYKTSFAQTTGNYYEDALANGATKPQAASSALLTGLINSAIEMGGGLETLPSELKSGSASAVRQWVGTMFDEGKESVVQGVIENLTAKTVYDKDKPLVSATDESAVINPKRAATEFGMGAVAGGVLGGGQILAGKAIDSARASRASQSAPAAASVTTAPTATQPVPGEFNAQSAAQNKAAPETTETANNIQQPASEVNGVSPIKGPRDSDTGATVFTGRSGMKYSQERASILESISDDDISAAVPLSSLYGDIPINKLVGLSEEQKQALRNAGMTYTESNAEGDGTTEYVPAAYLWDERGRRQDAGKSPSAQSVTPQTEGALPEGTGAMSSAYPTEQKVSKVYSNTLLNTDLLDDVAKSKLDPRDYTFDSVGEKQSVAIAKERLETDFDGEVADLSSKPSYTAAEDVDTAAGILGSYAKQAEITGDFSETAKWAKDMYAKIHQSAVTLQAMDKYSRTPEGAVIKAQQTVYNAEQKLTTKKENGKTVQTAQGREVSGGTQEIVREIEREAVFAAEKTVSDLQDEISSLRDQAKKIRGKIGSLTRTANSAEQKASEAKSRRDAARSEMREAEKNLRSEQARVRRTQQRADESISRDQVEQTPVEDWNSENGRLLAEKLIQQNTPKQEKPKTVMQTIFSDLLKFANEHAAPRAKSVSAKRSATDIIRDYFANKDAYTESWKAAQRKLRETYADSPEMLDAFDEWISSTVDYNADPMHTDKIMLSAVLSAADSIGLDAKTIRDLTALGTKESVISRISDAFVSAVGVDGANATIVRDAVRRHINELTESQPLPEDTLDSILRGAVKDTKTDISALLTQNWKSKQSAAESISRYILNTYEISEADAQAVSKRITDRFYEELAARSKSKVLSMLKPKNPSAKKTLLQRIDELYNLGAFDDASVSDLVKEKYGIPALTTADIQKIYEFTKLANDQTDDYQARRYRNLAARVISKKLPSTFKDKVLAVRRIAMLLNPKTVISRNAGGNLLFGAAEDIKDAPGTMVDYLTSLYTGKRTTSYNPFATAKAEAQGAKKGVSELAKDIKYGVDTSPTSHEMPSAPALKSKLGSGLETALNKLLQAGDRPFYEAAYAKRIDELKRLGLDYESADAAGEATAYALERVFQNNSELAKKAIKLRESLGVLGDVAIPFAQTPANILDKLADYSPYGYVRAIKMAGTVKDSAWSQKRFVDTLSRSLTGTGVILLGYFGFLNGLISGGDEDKDEKEQYQDKAKGFQPYSIRDGDKTYTYDWASTIGSLMAIGADAAQSASGEELVAKMAMAGFKAGVNVMFNQSYLEGMSDIFGSDNIADGLESMIIGLPASFVPTGSQQIAKVLDDYQRETYDSDPIKRAWNKMKAKIPGLSQTLEPKIGAGGQPMKNFQGRGTGSNILESFLSPGYVGENVQTPVDKEISRLFDATGDKAVLQPWSAYTSASDLKVSAGGKDYTLSPSEWTEYQQTRGQTGYEAVYAMIQSDEWEDMDDATKAKAVEYAYDYANEMAKSETVDYEPTTKWIAALSDVDSETVSATVMYKAYQYELEKTLKASEVNGKIREMLMDDTSLNSSTKSAVDEAILSDGMYIPKDTSVDYGNSETFALTQMSEGAQKKYPEAKKLGVTAQEWSVYYPTLSSGKKADCKTAFLNAGGNAKEFERLWKIIR